MPLARTDFPTGLNPSAPFCPDAATPSPPSSPNEEGAGGRSLKPPFHRQHRSTCSGIFAAFVHFCGYPFFNLLLVFKTCSSGITVPDGGSAGALETDEISVTSGSISIDFTLPIYGTLRFHCRHLGCPKPAHPGVSELTSNFLTLPRAHDTGQLRPAAPPPRPVRQRQRCAATPAQANGLGMVSINPQALKRANQNLPHASRGCRLSSVWLLRAADNSLPTG
jgi:hypothetical protein